MGPLVALLLAGPLAVDVVLLTPGDPSEHSVELQGRAAAEIRALGLEVRVVKGRAEAKGSRRVELVRAANRSHADAAVRLARGPESVRIDIWVTDGNTGKMRFREISLTDLPDDVSPERYIALALVEMLEGALIEVGIDPRGTPVPDVSEVPPEPPPPEPPPPEPAPVLTEPVGPEPIAWSAGVLLAASLSPGGLPIRSGVGVDLSAAVTPVADIGVVVRTAVVGSPLREDGQRVDYSFSSGAARAVWVPWRDGWWRPELGLAAGAFWLRSSGEATGEMVGRTSHAVGFLAQVLVGARAPIGDSLALRIAITAGVITPHVDVNFADRRVAGYGPLVVDATLGMTWCFANGPC